MAITVLGVQLIVPHPAYTPPAEAPPASSSCLHLLGPQSSGVHGSAEGVRADLFPSVPEPVVRRLPRKVAGAILAAAPSDHLPTCLVRGHSIMEWSHKVFCCKCGAQASTRRVCNLAKQCTGAPTSKVVAYWLKRLLKGQDPRTGIFVEEPRPARMSTLGLVHEDE